MLSFGSFLGDGGTGASRPTVGPWLASMALSLSRSHMALMPVSGRLCEDLGYAV
jgi:hypothetical protein